MERSLIYERRDEDQFVGLAEATAGLKCHQFMTEPAEFQNCRILSMTAEAYRDVEIAFKSGDQIVVQYRSGYIEIWEFEAGESERAGAPLWQTRYHDFVALLAY